jgi:CCR4-NOT transcription complex subunit 6
VCDNPCISGKVRNLSPGLWSVRNLTALFLNGNILTRIPAEIAQLSHLTMLDLSHNKLRSLPAELGDMISLCHLYLNHNQLRVLPYELGKLFRLQTLGEFGSLSERRDCYMRGESVGCRTARQSAVPGDQQDLS